ncbi:hypothetical protein EV127DRAFT_472125 [Xylaria flabelliformis]|nr:hypothetical protein EV127DRAFT_472125 [Xylaria flabelliformis]
MTTQNEVTDSFAPNWLPYFSSRNGAAFVHFKVDCQICDKRLAITEPVSDEVEEFCVLPCGHAFGYNCIVSWVNQQSTNANCPSCRFSLVHSCGHGFFPGVVKLSDGEKMRDVVSKRIVELVGILCSMLAREFLAHQREIADKSGLVERVGMSERIDMNEASKKAGLIERAGMSERVATIEMGGMIEMSAMNDTSGRAAMIEIADKSGMNDGNEITDRFPLSKVMNMAPPLIIFQSIELTYNRARRTLLSKVINLRSRSAFIDHFM